jgi:hypothetical protein
MGDRMAQPKFEDADLARRLMRLQRDFRKYQRARRRHTKCIMTRDRYLKRVYNLYVGLIKAGDETRVVREIELAHRLPHRIDRHLIGYIIAATSTVDAKVRHVWLNALLYAWRKRKTWDHLADFFAANGGVRGCSEKFVKLRHEPAPKTLDAVEKSLRFAQRRMRMAKLTPAAGTPVESFAFSKQAPAAGAPRVYLAGSSSRNLISSDACTQECVNVDKPERLSSFDNE